jgi:hypothetical protein
MGNGITKRSKVFKQLHRALDDGRRVRIGRSIDYADEIAGFVVAIGDDWVLMQVVERRFHLDGWEAIRIRDVNSIIRLPMTGKPGVVERVLTARNNWPVVAPIGCDVSSVRSIVEMARRHGELIEVHREKKNPYKFAVGRVLEFDGDQLTLHKLSDSAHWLDSREIPVRSITRLAFANDYVGALELIMEPVPAD